MRRVVESTLVSADGVIGEPHTWTGEHFGEEAVARALEQMHRTLRAPLRLASADSPKRCARIVPADTTTGSRADVMSLGALFRLARGRATRGELERGGQISVEKNGRTARRFLDAAKGTWIQPSPAST